jgi:anaerobic ribonucleoside-triphosphate reductase activating protein
MKIKIAGLVPDTIADGPGLRYAVYLQGCPHHCHGCHNPQTWDFNGGVWLDTADIADKINVNMLLDGVTISGGEPFFQAENLADLLKRLDKRLQILCYTGYIFEELAKNNDKFVQNALEMIDILVDGRFEEQKKDFSLAFRGSANQRFIDVQASLKSGKVVEKQL